MPQEPVTDRARPVYPRLDHFAYVSHVPFSEVRARQAARLVEDTTRASGRLYLLVPIDPRRANTIAQYGPLPPAEPDPWTCVEPDGTGHRLRRARPDRRARSEISASNRALAAGNLDEATRRLRRACRLNPDVPALWVALARLQLSQGRDRAATAALQRALRIDDRYFAAHLASAELLAWRGRQGAARRALARALALYPASQQAWDLAARLGPVSKRARAPRIFLDAGTSGAIVVGSSGGDASVTYALCRAAVRYEPRLREQVLLVPSDAPYRLSAGEELFCVEAMLGTYLSRRVDQDASLQELLRLARRGMLADWVQFDVIGQHRPEWLRLSPPRQLDSVTHYVEHAVLGRE
jgi:tetratricopeptide (TPR) repeat protein